jgi:hypothetical protein
VVLFPPPPIKEAARTFAGMESRGPRPAPKRQRLTVLRSEKIISAVMARDQERKLPPRF